MAQFPTKAPVKLAIPKGATKHVLSHNHISTTDYFKLGVNLCLPVPTKNTLRMKNKSFTRLNPMTLPSFGEAKIHQRYYFVPFSRIMKSYNDFVEQRQHGYDTFNNTTNIPTSFRHCKMGDFVQILTSSKYADMLPNTATDFDFQTYPGDKFKFKYLGRCVYNLLCQLGIKVEFTIQKDSAPLNYDVNIMTLLAFARVYLDYYYINTYETSIRVQVERILNSNAYGLELVTSSELDTILTFVEKNIFYDNDYFTSAWDTPVGSNKDVFNQPTISIDDNTLPSFNASEKSGVVASALSDGTPFVHQSNGQSTNVHSFTQYIDSVLKRTTQYVLRNRIVGSRIVDRFLARFGIKLTDAELQRSQYIGDNSFKIMFGDIFNTADTPGSGLGAFAGKGMGYGESDTIEFYNDEAGVYIGVQYVSPKIGYFQGIDRFSITLNNFDWWTPEYDNLGVDAVSQLELYCPMIKKTQVNEQGLRNKIFGYQPRYAWLKKKLDVLSGDFLFDSINAGMDAWHLFREIDPNNHINGTSPNEYVDIVHSLNFCNAYNDGTQYDRNFPVSKQYADNFTIINMFEIECYNSMKPIYDNCEFDDLDSKEILMDIGGKINNN